MDFSEQAFKMLDKFRAHPGLNGGKSLETLSAFFAGYISAYCDFTGRSFLFRALFQEFIERKYPPLDGKYHRYSWQALLMQHYPGEAAYDAFFEELELFKAEVGIGPDSLLYGRTKDDSV